MKMQTFEHFPEGTFCPICGNNNDKECILISIDGTNKGNICQAQPVHVECLLTNMRYNKEFNVIYLPL